MRRSEPTDPISDRFWRQRSSGHGVDRRSVIGALVASITAPASPWPTDGTVRMIVPFPAAGSIDAVARLIAPSLERRLGGSVIVVNVPGAGGRVGTRQAAQPWSGGKTLLLGTSATHAIAPSLFPDLGYRPEEDFSAVGCVCTSRLLLVASPTLQAHSLADLIRIARAAPMPLAYGSWGVGSGGHLLVEALRKQVALPLLHVPFQGVAPMMRSVLGGQIPLAISDVAGGVSFVRDNKLVPVVVSGTTRLPWLPDVGTLAEAGVAAAPESWCALFASSHTPEAELANLELALQATLNDPHFKEALNALALESSSLDRRQFKAAWHDDIAAWRLVVAAVGTGIRRE